MATTNTLTSLAMLKVNIDHGGDYLEYLRPFILQILVEDDLDNITDVVVSKRIRERFGLEIPQRTVQIVLRRLSRAHAISRKSGIYHITGELPDPDILAKQSEAKRHIDAVVTGLMQFSSDSIAPYSNRDQAESALRSFLTTFNVSCLRAYRRGTAIPEMLGQENTNLVMVSRYIIYLQTTNPERFDSFMVMVQGHMLANALLCPDLEHVSDNYKDVIFYLDTPLLVRYLGLEGTAKQNAVSELLRLLRNLNAKISTFSHSRDELKTVIRSAASYLESPDGRGEIVYEARRHNTTKSDLLLFVEKVNDLLDKAEIDVYPTPRYIERFQIDEAVFEDVLTDEVFYHNPRAMYYDINSVRSIYLLRENIHPRSLEKSRAVLVTSNAGFAQAAWNYEQGKENNGASGEVSSVIADFSLANLAWLKAPMGAPSLPSSEILALSYAALEPPPKLLDKFLKEIDRLENTGAVSARDHQLLRSSPKVYDELVGLTLGDENALSEETISETLHRVSHDIKKEETAKLNREEENHRITQKKLEESRQSIRNVKERTYWQCDARAAKYSDLAANLVGIILIFDLIISVLFWFLSESFIALAIASPIFVSVGIVTLFSRWYGISVIDFRKRARRYLRIRFLKHQSMATGIDMDDFAH